MGITIFVDDSSPIHSNILMLKPRLALELKIESIFSDNGKHAKIVSTIIGIASTMNCNQHQKKPVVPPCLTDNQNIMRR